MDTYCPKCNTISVGGLYSIKATSMKPGAVLSTQVCDKCQRTEMLTEIRDILLRIEKQIATKEGMEEIVKRVLDSPGPAQDGRVDIIG